MHMRLAPVIAVLVLVAGQIFSSPARAGDCNQGSDQEKIACLDAALKELARIIHGADLKDLDAAPECRGLLAISRGFPLVARDDHETMEKTAFLYDALYASLKQRQAQV